MLILNTGPSQPGISSVKDDLADEFVERRDFIGARRVRDQSSPMLNILKYASDAVPVRSQYAVVLACCGETEALRILKVYITLLLPLSYRHA